MTKAFNIKKKAQAPSVDANSANIQMSWRLLFSLLNDMNLDMPMEDLSQMADNGIRLFNIMKNAIQRASVQPQAVQSQLGVQASKKNSNIKKKAQSPLDEQMNVIRDNMMGLSGGMVAQAPADELERIQQEVMINMANFKSLYEAYRQQAEQAADMQGQIESGTPNANALENTGQTNMANTKNKKIAFNLKKAQPFNPPVGQPPMDDMGLNEAPEMEGDMLDQQDDLSSQGINDLKDGADLKDRLDTMDNRAAREELLNYIEEADQQQIVEDALTTFYQEGLESNEKLGISIRIFDMLPDVLKSVDPNSEEIIEAPFTSAKVDEEIKKLAKKYSKKEIKSYNLKKTAQHKSLENVVVWNTNKPRMDPFLRQPVSDWHIMERNKGFGLTVGDIWNIDWESIWRENIMDKYSRPYRDKEGNWVGGYLNKRFEIDRNIPETSNYQLKPGQKRRPILPEYGNLGSRLEAAREKGDIEGGPVNEGKVFNWIEASSKKKS